MAAPIMAVLLFWSWPGKPKPFVNESGRPPSNGISEKVRADINGFEQAMFLGGKDKTRPVLLYLHGGMPEYFLTRRHPTGLDGESVAQSPSPALAFQSGGFFSHALAVVEVSGAMSAPFGHVTVPPSTKNVRK